MSKPGSFRDPSNGCFLIPTFADDLGSRTKKCKPIRSDFLSARRLCWALHLGRDFKEGCFRLRHSQLVTDLRQIDKR